MEILRQPSAIALMALVSSWAPPTRERIRDRASGPRLT
jgi:hypothetical protein